MKFGFTSGSALSGLRPDTVARELEAHGFDSLWLPEHGNIPTSRLSPYPPGGDLPEIYCQMMQPFVALSFAAAVTERLTIATGICLVLEHEVVDLALAAATLDVLSNGRLILGVGTGWNREELANVRPDVEFKDRYAAMRERVAALRAIWSSDVVEFDGRWDRIDSSWINPKPIDRTIPIALGNAGPLGIRHVVEYADQWCPVDVMLRTADGRIDPIGRIREFRAALERAGREPGEVPVSLVMFARPTEERLAQYTAAGVERVILSAPHGVDDERRSTMEMLEGVAPMIDLFDKQ